MICLNVMHKWVRRHIGFAVMAAIAYIGVHPGVAVSATTATSSTVITCTGVGSDTINNKTTVYYDSSAGTCVVADGVGVGLSEDDMKFTVSQNSAEVGYTSKGGGGSKLNEHQTCTIGSFSAADGVNCSSDRTTNGNETATLSQTNASGALVTMSVDFSIGGGGGTNDITSATLTITTSFTSSDVTASLMGAISRSQAVVVSKNIGARVANIGGAGASLGKPKPAGVGRNEPGAGRSLPGRQSNFTQMMTAGPVDLDGLDIRSQGTDLRGLAMLASFDTSQMILAAAGAGNENDTSADTLSRASLLLDRPWTVWGHGSYTDVKNTMNDGTVSNDTRYNGDVWGYNVGFDYRLSPNLYAGVSGGYSKTDLITTYNAGTYQEDNKSLSPYAVWKPVQGLTVSAIAGYSKGDIDLTRTSGTVTATTDSAMWFGNVNGSYAFAPSLEVPLELKIQLGLLAAHKKIDAYAESSGASVAAATSNTRQIKPGIEAGYTFDANGTSIQPYVKGDFVYDFKDPTNGDNGAYNLGGGVRLSQSDYGLSGSLDAETQIGRKDYQEYTLSAMMAYGIKLGADTKTHKASVVEPYISSSFVQDSQMFGSGITYRLGSGAMSANFDLSHAVSKVSDLGEEIARLKVLLYF